MKIKNHLKFTISLAVILAIVFSVVSPLSRIFADEYTPPANMLYFKSTNSGPLMQKVTLEGGATYNLSFGLSNGSPAFTVVAQNTIGRTNISVNPTLITKTDMGKYDIYKYSLTIPTSISKAFVGLSFAAGKEGYIFDLKLEKSGDSSHTNLFKNSVFATNLDNWAWGENAHFVSTDTGKNYTEFIIEDISLKIVSFDQTKFPDKVKPEPDKDKMLYFKGKNADPLMSRVALIPGAKYNLSFGLSDNVTEFAVICKNDDRQKLAINSNEESREIKDKYVNYIYSFTVPSNAVADAGGGKALVFVGFAFPTGTEGYMFNVKLEKSDDETHTQILPNGYFRSKLDNWAWGYSWFVDFPQQLGTGHSDYDGSDATLKVMDYDESKFTLKAPEKPKDKMLYFKGKNTDPFVQRVGLIPGEKYNISFGLTNNVVDFSVTATNDDRNKITINSTEEKKEIKEKYTNYTYSFTVPSGMKTDAGGGKALVFIGLSFPRGTEGYLFNLHLEKSNDASHTKLLSNGDFKSGLDYWAWGYNWFINFPSQKGLGYTEFDGSDATLKVMDYDESKFTLKAPEKPKDKMLYIKNETSGPLSQRVVLEKGKKYYYSFYVSKNMVGAKISVKTNDSPARKDVSVNPNLLQKVDEGKHTYYKYEFTVPETFKPEEGKTTNFAFVGVSFITGYDGYFYNPKLERADGDSKKQMLSNSDFKSGLDYFDWDYSWFINFPGQLGFGKTEYTTKSKDELKVIDFDENLFSTEIPDIPLTNHRMLYFRNGANPSLFALRVKSYPGKTYILKYSVFSTEEVGISVATDGDRNNISAKAQLIGEPVEHKNYTTYTYKFTLPATYNKNENFIFAGVKIPYYAEGYIFDMSCYLADDKDKTELFSNPGFMKDLDGWIWGWDAWFGLGGNWQPSGMTKWTNGIGLIKIMDFDSTKFDELIADINRDDGVWWSSKDYNPNKSASKETGSAILKGTFKDNYNRAVAKRKLILRSDEHSYITYTDSSGRFAFKGIVPGVYELFSVNNSGAEMTTGFYELIEDGDILTVPFVSDLSGLDLSDDVTETENLASFSGTVFTPQLKTVSDLKLFLRGFGEVTTDKNGQFEFTDVPEGDYEIYTVLPNKKEYVFRTVSLKKNIKLAIKLKYDVADGTDETDSGDNTTLIILISAISAGVVLLGTGGTTFILIRKKKLLKVK